MYNKIYNKTSTCDIFSGFYKYVVCAIIAQLVQ